MTRFTLILAALILGGAQQVDATLVRLGFSGEMVATFPYDGTDATGSFSGSIVLDTATPDVRPEENDGYYPNGVTEAHLVWNDVTYEFLPSRGGSVYVANDRPVLNDAFAVILDFVSDDGDTITFGIQLVDTSRTVFSNDSLPEYLDLAQFDPIDVTDAYSTFAIILPWASNDNVQGSIEFAQLRPVPVPATFWLLASSLIAGFGFRPSTKQRQ